MNQKINISLNILLTKDQHEKIKLISFYSKKSIGKLLRNAIDNLELAKFVKEK